MSIIFGMKNMLFLGDSIRIGYQPFLRKRLEARAGFFAPPDNGRYIQYTFRELDEWRALFPATHFDLVHWNCGLWDVKHLCAGFAGPDGEAAGLSMVGKSNSMTWQYDPEPLTPPEFYRHMLRRVDTRIRALFPKAAIVFATTTPVTEERTEWGLRTNAEIDDFNRIAREELEPRGELINDLCGFSRKNCGALHRDWVHYTDEGSDLLAGEIVKFLENAGLLG